MHFTFTAVLCTLSLLLSTAAAGPLPALPIFNPNAAVLDTAPDYAETGQPPSFKPPVSAEVVGMSYRMQNTNSAVTKALLFDDDDFGAKVHDVYFINPIAHAEQH
ncbi:MAG: hypothetical protein L6R35_000150 [Caloplaca aegaea]|nr:MAG: hypothetical protein L6R35_000150 [Caloplaca aegaea]